MNVIQAAVAAVCRGRYGQGGGSGVGGGGGGGGTTPILNRPHTTSGSMVGGVGGNGHYLKLFGQNFGLAAAIGTVFGAMVYMRDTHAGGDNAWHQVATYNYLETALHPSGVYQTLCVQVGGLGGGCANGNAVDIKVTVNGVDSNILASWYTLQPGDTWYVSPATGSDSTFVKNDITKPAKHIQFWTGSAFTGLCAPGGPQPGDMIVFVDDGDQTEQHGYYNGSQFGSIFRFAFQSGSWAKCVGGGSIPTGVVGHGFVHFFLGLPGSGSHTKPHFNLTVGGGFQGLEGANASTSTSGNGNYVSITGGTATTRTGAKGDAGFVSTQTGAHVWQISDMEYLGWEADAVTITNSSGFGGNLQGFTSSDVHPTFCIFTSSHDVSGNLSQKQNHCYYWGGTESNGGAWPGGATSWLEFGWNYGYNAVCGSIFQFFWAGTQSATVNMQGLYVHDCVGDTTVKYCLNFGESVVSGKAVNCQFSNAGVYAIRFASPDVSGWGVTRAINVEYCTIYGWNTQGAVQTGAIGQAGFSDTSTVTVKHCLIVGDDTRSTTCTYYGSENGQNVGFDQNLYFDYKGTATGQPTDSHAITTSPLLVARNASPRNLSTATNGGGVNAGTTASAFPVPTDILGNTRPIGAHPDLGCFEVA